MRDMSAAANFAGRARQELPRGAAPAARGPVLAMHCDERGARDGVMRTAIVTNVLSAKDQAMFGMSVRA